MAFISLNYFSEALGKQTEVYVVLPQKSNDGEIGIGSAKGADNCKCLYLLHGHSDDHTIWMRRTSIERYATEYGICVVMPCGDRSFYTDMKYAMKYYTFVAKELPGVLEAHDMTPEASVTKLMWVLGQTDDRALAQKMFTTPIQHDLL